MCVCGRCVCVRIYVRDCLCIRTYVYTYVYTYFVLEHTQLLLHNIVLYVCMRTYVHVICIFKVGAPLCMGKLNLWHPMQAPVEISWRLLTVTSHSHCAYVHHVLIVMRVHSVFMHVIG